MNDEAQKRLERFQARLESERQLMLSELEIWLRKQQDETCQELLAKLTELNYDQLLESLNEVESPKAQKYKSRLQAIDASLCQLDLGLYGYCADCEQEIEPELIQRDPTRQRCKHCHELHLKSKQKKTRILL